MDGYGTCHKRAMRSEIDGGQGGAGRSGASERVYGEGYLPRYHVQKDGHESNIRATALQVGHPAHSKISE